jgi:single-strand DNA-binding protein
MASLATQLVVAGNLTRDPELRYTQAGKPVLSFSIATTPRTYDSATKDYVDGEAIFTNCVQWGPAAENVAASVSKGSRVIVVGQLKSRTYQTREGETKTATELVVDEMGASLLFASMDIHRGGASKSGPAAGPASAPPVVSDDEPW